MTKPRKLSDKERSAIASRAAKKSPWSKWNPGAFKPANSRRTKDEEHK